MEQTPATTSNEDQGTTAREQIITCLKNLSKNEYNNLLNEMMTKDF